MKNLLIGLFLFLAAACGNVDAQEVRTAEIKESDEAVVNPVLEYGADVNRGPCATNYTRTAPGVCGRNSISAFSGLSAVSCNSFTETEIGSNAKTIFLEFRLEVRSNNVIENVGGVFNIYDVSDTTCSGSVVQTIEFSVRDYGPTANNTQIATVQLPPIAIKTDSTKFVNIGYLVIGSTNNSIGSYAKTGYTD